MKATKLKHLFYISYYICRFIKNIPSNLTFVVTVDLDELDELKKEIKRVKTRMLTITYVINKEDIVVNMNEKVTIKVIKGNL